MLCSKKMVLPSKFNVKLQKRIWEALASLGLPKFIYFGGGVRDLGQGGGDFFSGGPGGGGYQHPVAMYDSIIEMDLTMPGVVQCIIGSIPHDVIQHR
jgi:hypothetical protein